MDGISTSVTNDQTGGAGYMDRIRSILSSPKTEEPEPTAYTAPDDSADETESGESPESQTDDAQADAAQEPSAEPAPAAEMTASEKAKYAKLLVDNERLHADFLRLKKQMEGASDLSALAEKARGGDRAAALELLRKAGTEFDDLGEAVLKDEKLRKPQSAETPEQRKTRELEERLARMEREKAEFESRQVFDQEIKLITDTFDADSPLKALPWAPGEVHKRYYAEYERTKQLPDLKRVIADVESTFTGDVKTASNARLLKTLLSDKSKVEAVLADPELKKMFADALSAEKTAQAQQGNKGAAVKGGPSQLSRKAASEVPVRKPAAPPTQEELRQRAVQAFISGGNK